MTTEDLVDEIFGRCRERIERGEEVDVEEVLRAHPDLAVALRGRFAAARLLDQTGARDRARREDAAALRVGPTDALEGREFRELLTADVALTQGLASVGDVAAALQGFWERRDRADASVVAEFARIAGIDREALRSVELLVDGLVAQAGGDARIALDRRGGLDRSVHLALGGEGRGLTRMLSVLGVPIRAPLAPVRPDRYTAFEAAGRGGMGVVYAAVDTEMNRRVAFKMVRTEDARAGTLPSSPLEAPRPAKDSSPQSEKFEQLKARLVQEAWVTGSLEHPGIVPVYEIGQTQTGIPYYTMRYVRGERTLADAIDENRGAPFEERLALLEPFLKVCDTLRYAHAEGVVHRDLKPANVALGQYGEVVLLDWGLARLEGREDVASSAWQERIEELRHGAGFHTMEGRAVGTAGYMSPEATLGRLAEVDRRSDVYSLGVILFEVLTGRLPFEFRSYAEYASLLLRQDPPSARAMDASVPEALSALCARALSREKESRPASAEEIAGSIRAWQVETAMDREIESLLRDARGALDAAAQVEGEARLFQVNRATAALAQVTAKRPAYEEVPGLRARAETLREEGIGQRERAAARRLLRRVVVGGLAAAVVAALVVTTVIEGKRREAEEARTDAVEAKKATDAALDDVLRLADSKRVRDLVAEVDQLWPLEPERADAMAAWIGRAKNLLGNRDGHLDRLARIRASALPYSEATKERDHAEHLQRIDAAKKRLEEILADTAKVQGENSAAMTKALNEQAAAAARERLAALEASLDERHTWAFADPSGDWQHQVLLDLLAGLDRLDGGGKGGGALAEVENRHAFVTALRRASIEDHAEEWKEAVERIAASPKYGGRRIAPQLGLVPLGPDPESGLYEFAHVGSGSIPTRDAETERLVYAEDAAVVLVLIPAGTFKMGAQRENPSAPNYDPEADNDESPVHEVTLSPFFIAKHECTQAQWKEMTGGLEPSSSKAGKTSSGRDLTPRNPVEHVSWEDCMLWLGRNRLVLPTEAQWEYACRAGTDTPWNVGRNVADLSKVANLADAFYAAQGAVRVIVSPEINDGHAVHAPVGSFAPNSLGLFDVHGNVHEWCRDASRLYSGKAEVDPVREGSGLHVTRGGSWGTPAGEARSAQRAAMKPEYHNSTLGVRPARALSP